MSDKIRSISYSFLQKLDLGPQYINIKEEEHDYFIVGNLVDCLLTQPDELYKKFCFFTEDDISPTVKKIIDKLSRAKSGIGDEQILKVAKEMGYGDGWKPETVLRKILEKGETYYEFLKLCTDKPIVTKAQEQQAKDVVQSLLNDPFTRNIIKPVKSRSIDLYTQLRVDWKYEDIPATSRLDYLTVDHQAMTIQPDDLKTTSGTTNKFRSSFAEFGYGLQASFYTEAVKYWKEKNGLKKYKVLPFRFIVESTKTIGNPLIYECSPNDLYCGKYGGRLKGGVYRKGFDQLVADYRWYIEHDTWTHNKEYIENGGKMTIDAFETIEGPTTTGTE